MVYDAVDGNKPIQEHSAVLRMEAGEGSQTILQTIRSNGSEPRLSGGTYRAANSLKVLFLPLEYFLTQLPCLGKLYCNDLLTCLFSFLCWELLEGTHCGSHSSSYS